MLLGSMVVECPRGFKYFRANSTKIGKFALDVVSSLDHAGLFVYFNVVQFWGLECEATNTYEGFAVVRFSQVMAVAENKIMIKKV